MLGFIEYNIFIVDMCFCSSLEVGENRGVLHLHADSLSTGI